VKNFTSGHGSDNPTQPCRRFSLLLQSTVCQIHPLQASSSLHLTSLSRIFLSRSFWYRSVALSQISALEHTPLKIANTLLSRLHGAWTRSRLFSSAETYFILHSPINVSKTNRSMATASLSKPAKLHGRAFYESIGSPMMIVAPMVDRSEFVSTRSFRGGHHI
jgi:hypothetical protein